ncbi:uncharacterized protein LOC110764321 [Prunus avium]|uniref:Uncharacterized protein LOC110764321 n=1 Tax=Prunus avium TaxID=42229 RepID=A0A6P5T721_PRUAV|nr:uncharacterized protein LOC110764321 [Prunus avium]
MPDFAFKAGVSGSTSDGPSTGEKRARTQEMADVGGSESPEPPLALPPFSMSFKDKVSGDFGLAQDNFVFGEDDFVIKNGPIPSIDFSEKVKDCLYRPWRTAVIIKLMGRPLSYTFLRNRLLQRWALKGPMSLIDLDNNFFIVKFLLEEDMNYVLTGGPWQIAGQYLATQRRKPGFNPKEERITHMTAWVRINGLNVEYFRTDIMEKIGNLVGQTVKVDAHTMSQARGKFARVCVELNLAKPLTPFIVVEGRTFGVVYEGIQLVCFECGCYGHGRDSCPVILQTKKQETESANSESANTESMKENTTAVSEIIESKEETTPVKQIGVDSFSPENLVAENPAKIHGQWMLMKPKISTKKNPSDQGRGADTRKKISKRDGNEPNLGASGSRFSVLDNGDNNDMAVEEPVAAISPPSADQKASMRKPNRPFQPANSKLSGSGKQTLASRDPKGWMSKKPLKDISNQDTLGGDGKPPSSGTWGHLKNNFGARPLAAAGLSSVGMQVPGADVQDDIAGKFSFNVTNPFTGNLMDKGTNLSVLIPPDPGNNVTKSYESSPPMLSCDTMEISEEQFFHDAHDVGMGADLPVVNDAPRLCGAQQGDC